MKTILSLLFALLAFTAMPSTQAKADLYNAGGMAAIASESVVGHRHYHDRYYGRPHYRGGYRGYHRSYYHRPYYRGYHRNYYGPRRNGITIRF